MEADGRFFQKTLQDVLDFFLTRVRRKVGAWEELYVSQLPVVWNKADGIAISSTGFGVCVEYWADGVIDLIPRTTELSSARLGNNVRRS